MEPLIGIGEVIEHLRGGPSRRAWRRGWNGQNQVIMLQEPDDHSKMTEPYTYMFIRVPGSTVKRIPWLASQADLLADDWELG